MSKYLRRVRPRLALGMVCGWFVATAFADEFSDATRPLSEGIPGVALVRLRELLGRDLSPELRAAAKVKLAEALIAVGRAEEALPLFDDAPANAFLHAQALAALRRWSEALSFYETAIANSAQRAEAQIGAAEALRALDRKDDALRLLAAAAGDPRWQKTAQLRSAALLLDKGLVDDAARMLDRNDPKLPGDRREKRFLRGRVAVARRQRDRAIELFTSILKSPEGAPHSLIVATLLAISDLQLQLKAPDNGARVLEDFIEHHGTDTELAAIFRKLEQLYRAQRQPTRTELTRWANDNVQPRRAFAQWYLARMQLRAKNTDAARKLFEELRASRPTYAPIAEAYLDFAELLLADNRVDEASKVFDEALALRPNAELRARIEFEAAQSQYRLRHWPEAAERFTQVAQSLPEFGNAAKFDAALSWLEAGEKDRAAATATDENARGELLLEQGLAETARGEQNAAGTLQKFAQQFPEHARLAEAYLALAELAFHSRSPRVADAEKFLARADSAKPAPEVRERADYLRIWIADAAPDPAKPNVITLATQFLQQYPAANVAGDVRMKLAEAYFRRQDFANAQTQFESLAQQQPNGPYAEKALFFAAQSALQSMGAQSLDRALTLFGEVVKRNGELKWAARNEQAALERKLGKSQDALPLYDEVLRSDAQPPEKREALCGKADTLYELGANEPEKYKAALALYNELASDAKAPAHWKNQALVKAGMCLEKLNERPQALETFYRVIEQETRPDRAPEFFWFYKAGFNAARLLEEEAKWASAASVYQKLALVGGDRSDEAKSRLSRLRLEHFLWEQ